MAVRTELDKYLHRNTGPSPAMGAKTCWARIRGSSGDYGHVWGEIYLPVGDYNALVIRDNRTVIIQSEQASYQESADLFTATYDAWYYLAWTYDGTTSRLQYLASGATAFAGAVTILPVHSANPWDWLKIGQGNLDLDFFFDGEIAALKIWSGAVPSDAALLAERQYRNPLSNLANVWATYQLKSGALGTDSSGNSRPLTETGSPSFAADPVDILGDDPSGTTFFLRRAG